MTRKPSQQPESPVKTGKELDKEKCPRSKGWFKPGHDSRRNYDGRPKGSRSWHTDFEMAIKQIAETMNKSESDVRVALLAKGLQEALRGDSRFWTYIIDREYGKTSQPIEGDVDVEGAKELATAIQELLEDDENEDQDKPKNQRRTQKHA